MRLLCSMLLVGAALTALTVGCDGDKPQGSGAAVAGPYANTVCPIMGNPIDPANVPASLTREYHGKKVAFCCAGCPTKWDALNDQERAAKLATAAAGASEKR